MGSRAVVLEERAMVSQDWEVIGIRDHRVWLGLWGNREGYQRSRRSIL